jgi:hypothetical protein
MTKFDAKLTKKEKALLTVILSRTEDKRDRRGTILEWKEMTKLGFKPKQTKEQVRALTDKLCKQQVAFIVEKGYDAEIVSFPVLTKCRIMDNKTGGWTIMFSVSGDVVARNVRSFARIEAQNNLADRFLALCA